MVGQILCVSYIFDPSNNILDFNGTLTIVVSIKEEERKLKPFVPKNSLFRMMQGMFLDESTADVSFDVKVHDTKTSSTVSIHAHSQILQGCAHMLAVLFEPPAPADSPARNTRSARKNNSDEER